MDGIHDLGGMAGFGEVDHEGDEPVFHEPRQATAYALPMAAAGPMPNHNSDEYSHSIERMDPQQYLSVHYFELSLRLF